jgi:Domain of unknown function (DUF4386)
MPKEIEASQQIAAKIAGLSYLIAFAIVVSVNYGIHARLVTTNAASTASNILAHEALFRVGMAGDVLYCAGSVVLLTALYIVLQPVNRGLALASAFLRLVWVFMWLVMTLQLFYAVRLDDPPSPLHAMASAQFQLLAQLQLDARFDAYYVGLFFGAAASTICAWLWLKSRYIPRWLAAFGLVASAWCVACALIFYVSPRFSKTVNLYWFDTPMGLFDIATSFWLIIRGLRLPIEPLGPSTPT